MCVCVRERETSLGDPPTPGLCRVLFRGGEENGGGGETYRRMMQMILEYEMKLKARKGGGDRT